MTIETHGMEFVVDASGVEKGFHDYEAAVQGIFKSLDQFEKKVASTMKGVESAVGNRSALSGFKKSLEGFSNINIDTRAAGKLSALSAAMGGFKAPSTTQATNTRKFFTALENLPDLSAAFRSIKNLNTLKASLEGFKAPPLTQANNLKAFANVINEAAPAFNNLKRISGISGIANELATISIALRGLKVPSASQISNLGNFGLALQHLGRVNTGETGTMLRSLGGISNFKAPTAANIRNLVAFAEALRTIKPIPQAAEIAAQMNMMASAASNASIKLAGFRGSLGGFNSSYGQFSQGTAKARVEMMGLQNAFSTTFQVGSVLRSLLGSLTIAELGRGFFQATQDANQFRAAMDVLGESPMMSENAWERVRADANHFGADLHTVSESFSKFSLAAHENGVSLSESFKIFEGFQTVMTATHMGIEQQQSVGLAIREMMDQGYVSTQRLTRQLGLVLPGATHTLLEAWKASGSKLTLWDALKKKLVDSQWALDVLSNHYKTVFGPGVEKALQSPIQQFNILKNNIMQMMVQIGDAGAKKAFADLIAQISGYMDPGKVHTFAESIGIALTGAVNKASEALKFLHDHWDSIVVPLGRVIKLVAEWEILMGSLQIGKWMVSPLLGMARVLPILQSVGAYLNVMAAKSLPAAAAGAARLEGAQRAAAVSALGLRNAATVTAIGLEEEAVAANGLSGSLLRLATSAGASAVGGLRSLVNLVGGPYIATIAAATYAGVELFQTYQSGQATIDETNKFLQESTNTVADATAKIYLHSTALKVANKAGIDFNDCTKQAPGFFDAYKAKMDKVTGGLYSMAVAARNATIETLKLQQAQNQGQLANLQVNSSSEVHNKAGELFKQGRYALSLGADLKAGTDAFSSLIGWDASQKDIDSQISKIRQNADNIQKSLAAAQNKPVMDIVADMKAAGLAAPDRTDPLFHGSDGEGNKKAKKGPNPYTEINHVENAIDDLMKRLDAEDPIGKLYDEFTKNITKESKDLLTAGGHKEWLAEIAKGGSTAEVATQSLINMLEKGTGVSAKQLADLQKRYGKGIPEIVAALKEQLDQLHAHEVEAMAKTIEAEHKSIMDARKMIGEFDPTTKINDDMIQKIKPLAEQLFKGDPEAFKKFYDPLIEGTKGAGQGIAQLSVAMEAANTPASKLNANLEAMGITGDRLKAITEGLAQGFRYQTAMAEEALVVGGKLLRTKKEDLMLMGLSADQQTIMKDLQQEVNDRLNAYLPISATEIAQLKEKLTAYKSLANQMQRANDFYQNNGIRTYLNGIQDVGAAINDLDKSALQSLEDQLVSLGTTGKFSFKAIFDTIQQGIVKMAAQGLVSNFTQMIFGKDQLNNGQPSIFGGTIGKMLGGYQAKQSDPWGKTPSTAFYVKNVPGYGGAADTVSSRTGNLLNHPETGVGQVTVDGLAQGPAALTNKMLGTSPATPMFVRDADKALTGMLGGGGGAGIQFPNGNSYSYDADGYITPNSGNSGGAVPGAVGGAGQSPAAAAGATVATSFKSNMAQMIPMVGMMFAGAFKSPIAQIGAMFLSMMLSQMMSSQAGAAAGAGGGGGLFGSLAKLGMSIFGGGAPVPGGLEGGITGALVNSYRVSPAAFINAPHYSEGTPNTSGGHAAILHDNEAVIPLSRGRKVAVELTGKSGSANGQTIVNNFNVNSPDADSFRKSKQQVMTDMHGAASRAFARNM